MASGYAKSVKNVAMQYPEIKIKTLEATSNEKWGPTGNCFFFGIGLTQKNKRDNERERKKENLIQFPSLLGTQMSELSNASYSYECFPIIMETLWERINDTGKNWRHVYKVGLSFILSLSFIHSFILFCRVQVH